MSFPIFILTVILVLTVTEAPARGEGYGPKPEMRLPAHAERTVFRSEAKTASGRRYRFEHITVEDGLSQSTVRSILQDSRGFLWFGTDDGLNRYDGYRFTVFKHIPDDPRSLLHNLIWSICEAGDGNLWIGTHEGLNRFDRRTETFVSYMADPDHPRGLSQKLVRVIYEDASGVIWIGTNGGLNRYHPETDDFTRSIHDPDDPRSLSHNSVRALLEDSSGRLWIGTYEGLNRFNRKRGDFQRYLHDPENPFSLSHNRIRSILEGKEGRLWIGTRNGLNLFDPETERFTRYRSNPENPFSLSHDSVRAVYRDSSGNIWVGTDGGGLNLYDRHQDRFIRFRSNSLDPHSLSHDRIRSIYEDNSRLLWVGTYKGNLNRLNREKRFVHYRIDPFNPRSIDNNRVRAVCEDASGIIWIGTNRGLNRLNRETGDARLFTFSAGKSTSPDAHSVLALKTDASGDLWAGTFGSGLFRISPETGTAVRYFHQPDDPGSISDNKIRSLHFSSGGHLWIGTFAGGLNRYNEETGNFDRFDCGFDTKSTSDRIIYDIFEEEDGHLWIGTGFGLIGLNPGEPDASPVYYRKEPGNPESISDNGILSICRDSGKRFWIGTFGGFNLFDAKRGKFRQFQEKDGLANRVVYGILEDRRGSLWLSTNKGLSKFDPETGRFRNYDVKDGLQGKEFYPIAYHRGESGEMFFGGVNGLNAFLPEDIRDNPHIPPVIITDFQLFNTSVPVGETADGRTLLKTAVSETRDLFLNYTDRVFSFEFAALDFRIPERNQFSYLLEGFDTDWRFSGSRNFVTYTNLNPGEYRFQVRGSNSDGVWNHTGASIRIRIRPPWWRTRWFLLTVLLFCASALVAGDRLRVRGMNLQKLALEKEVGERTAELSESNCQLHLARVQAEEAREKAESASRAKSAFLANMSHELRSPLHAVLGFAQVMVRDSGISRKHLEYIRIIIRSGEHLLTLINQVLDLSKVEAGRMSLNRTDFNLHSLLNETERMFQLQAGAKGLRLKAVRSSELPGMIRGDRTKLRQILINLLNNAIKFTREGEVVLKAGIRELPAGRALTFDVADTGPGLFPEEISELFEAFVQTRTGVDAQEGTGLGLTISRKFVHLMGGEMTVLSPNPEAGKGKGGTGEGGPGAVFRFHFPLEAAEGPDASRTPPGPVICLAPGQPEYRILVVDDAPDNRKMLTEWLTSAGFQTREADSGETAVKLWEEWHPDLICMDIRMPGMSGIEAARIIRTRGRTRPPEPEGKRMPVRIIALTASLMTETRDAARSAGCDDYLTKPLRESDLFECMGRLLKVHYRYAPAVPASFESGLPVEAESVNAVFSSTEMQQLPASLFENLESAICMLDRTEIQEAVNRIRKRSPGAGAILSEMAEAFRYDEMREMISRFLKP